MIIRYPGSLSKVQEACFYSWNSSNISKIFYRTTLEMLFVPIQKIHKKLKNLKKKNKNSKRITSVGFSALGILLEIHLLGIL